MPFHSFEGETPHRPLVAMEVFDQVSEKYPKVLRDIFGNLLNDPAAMAKACVEKYGADLISVRLDGTHPEKGDRTAAQAVETVKAVLEAVDVPLIVTGHNHFEKVNEVMKAVASACAGENLLLNWAEQNNYKAIAGAALAYGHTVVAQGPLDVNITKQLCILMSQMGVPAGQDRHRPHGQRRGIRGRILLFRHGAHPPDRVGRRPTFGPAHDRGRRAGVLQD